MTWELGKVLYLSHFTFIPQLPSFCADESLPIGEVTYNEWRFEKVYCENYSDITELVLRQAIRHSPRGSAP